MPSFPQKIPRAQEEDCFQSETNATALFNNVIYI